MIRSATITNFRCFESVELPKCKRINIIVGKNAAGKTALLEALWVATAHSPEVVDRLRRWRGYEPNLTGTFAQIDKSVWSDLFHRYDLERVITVRLSGRGPFNRSLTISYKEPDTIVPITTEARGAGVDSGAEFVWKSGTKKHRRAIRPKFVPATGYEYPVGETSGINASFFASSVPFNNAESVRRFSALSTSRIEKNFIEAIKKAFPIIEGIDVQAHAGVAMLHADIPSFPRKIPLSAISSGVHKMTTILLAMTESQKGVVFIDEIENAFHYSLYQSFWRTIHQFAKDNSVQIFASTHSDECLRALAVATEKSPKEVSLIRTDLSGGIATVEQFVGVSAVKYGEVR